LFVPSYVDTEDFYNEESSFVSIEEIPTFTYDRWEALDVLFDAYNEACDCDGDEENEYVVSSDLLETACRFLLAVPLGTPLPEPDFLPNESVAFVWYAASRRRLTVAVSEDGALAYSALLGRYKKAKGTAIFIDAVPEEVMRLVDRVMTR
jgi:hypothetical protein